jgi:hypothetical protein
MVHPMKKQSKLFIYHPSIYTTPKDARESEEIIQGMRKLNMHPGSYAWENMVGWGEAIRSAMYAKDKKFVMSSYPNMPEHIPAAFAPAITWESTLSKVVLSFLLMIKGIPVPYGDTICTPTEFSKALLYLSLNAFRNVASDLIAKYGFEPESWAENTGQIKWDKLTTSMVVTSFAYSLLAPVKAYLHSQLGFTPMEIIATPLTVMCVDGALQIATRKLRGSDNKLAFWDFGRPFCGDIFATVASLYFPRIMSDNFLYLLTRKVPAEIWSGIGEGGNKREEKNNERKDALKKIFDFERYKVPHPEAMAAIDLACIARKSVSPIVFPELIKNIDSNTAKILKRINQAMGKDNEIKATIDFIFPPDSPIDNPYNEMMWARFLRQRKAYDRLVKNKLT